MTIRASWGPRRTHAEARASSLDERLQQESHDLSMPARRYVAARGSEARGATGAAAAADQLDLDLDLAVLSAYGWHEPGPVRRALRPPPTTRIVEDAIIDRLLP